MAKQKTIHKGCLCNKKSKCARLKVKVKEQPNDFVQSHILNYEEYALMSSHDMNKLRNGKNNEGAWAMIVKIKKGKHTIYRKAQRCSDIKKKGTILLGYRSRAVLEKHQTTIEPACWFCYCWNHFNSVVRWPFRIAVIALGFALISTIKDLIDIIHLF